MTMPARSPEDLLRLFEDGLNAGDADAVAALYEASAILVAEPQRVVKGRAAILDGLKNFVAVKPRMVLNASRIVRNGDIAILYSDWTMSGTRPDGTTFSVDVRPTVVAREHTDGVWRVAIDDPSVDSDLENGAHS
jgi:uncharacterized protein (TIGR02246 family)